MHAYIKESFTRFSTSVYLSKTSHEAPDFYPPVFSHRALDLPRYSNSKSSQ
jgi:hypothetical protein